MFSCEFCEISKNTFFTEHLWATASALSLFAQQKCIGKDPRNSYIAHVIELYSLYLSIWIFKLSLLDEPSNGVKRSFLRGFLQKVVLEISEDSQENIAAVVAAFIKIGLHLGHFPNILQKCLSYSLENYEQLFWIWRNRKLLTLEKICKMHLFISFFAVNTPHALKIGFS